VNGTQDSSPFILLHEQSKVFKISYTNCPGNVCPGKVLSGKCPVLSGKRLVRETSVRESDCPGNVRYPELSTPQVRVHPQSFQDTPGANVSQEYSSIICMHRMYSTHASVSN